jgi:acetyltransferase-like isoleucine patch superfamily enzyme
MRGRVRWRLATGASGAGVVMLGPAPVLHVFGRVSRRGSLRFRTITQRASVSVAPGGELVLGDGVFINQGVTIHAERRITIGARVLIADGATIYDTDFHGAVPGEPSRIEPVTIGDDVWIGNGALVLPGVSIGRGSVVAARAVVTRDVPAGAVVAGSPAKIVRTFDVPEDFRRLP